MDQPSAEQMPEYYPFSIGTDGSETSVIRRRGNGRTCSSSPVPARRRRPSGGTSSPLIFNGVNSSPVHGNGSDCELATQIGRVSLGKRGSESSSQAESLRLDGNMTVDDGETYDSDVSVPPVSSKGIGGGGPYSVHFTPSQADDNHRKKLVCQQVTPHTIREMHHQLLDRANTPAKWLQGEATPTVIVLVPACLQHNPALQRLTHQECPERIMKLEAALRSEEFATLEWAIPPSKGASMTDILRVHEYEYIEHLEKRCLAAAELDAMEDMNACGANGVCNKHNNCVSSGSDRLLPPAGFLDSDTRISPQSFEVASKASQAVIEAVDRVVKGRNSNAFVIIRPPGHHAGPRGSVPSANFWKSPDMNSSGFCLLNNVAIGASYARAHYGREEGPIQRVAIVDFDIHHGNGTEEIVRCLTPQRTALPLPGSWAPVHVTTYKPWLEADDRENVLFASINLVNGPSFYPGSGSAAPPGSCETNIINIELSPINGVLPGDGLTRSRLPRAKLEKLCALASKQLRDKCEAELFPRLRAFRPDLLLISAGFDGHFEDMYHFNTDEDYNWLTTELCGCCRRVVSVLEGGYSLAPILRPVERAPVSRSKKSVAKEGEVLEAFGLPITQPQPNAEMGGLARGVTAHVSALMTAAHVPS